MASVVGLNKVFILDKYFTELTKYWQSEYQLQEKQNKAGSQQQQQPSNFNYAQNYGHHQNKSQGLFTEEGPLGGVARPLVDINDLIHLDAPITEDSLIRALQSRFNANEYFTNIGPVLISINAFNDQNNALTLNSTYQHQQQQQQNGYSFSGGNHPQQQHSPLLRVVHEAVRQQRETGYPQAIILSGSNGSGKTYASMVILRQLFNVVGGGPETDAFKHLAAAFTVLRSLGSASTVNNSESSRIGNFIEVQVTDGAIYRTKIHCYFLDQSRVVRTPPSERNYHIFYQMLAGLSSNDKTKLYLDGYTAADFAYLNCATGQQQQHLDYHHQDVTRFQAWKSCLSVLGIPFLDVVRVLAAVLLLGNIQFDQQEQSSSKDQHRHNTQLDFNEPTSSSGQKKELQAVANLLGVSSTTLYKGLTTVTYSGSSKSTSGLQTVRSRRTTASSKAVRDSLAKALYIRTVATIIRRANSSKRIGSSCGTTSSESNESIHNTTNHETGSNLHQGSHNNAGAPASSIGSACGKSYRTMAVLNSAVRYATMDGFIGILDMFGFEDGRLSRLEQLCINLCAETMQHFYNTHIFKASIESCRDEGVRPDIEIDFVDNVPCIDFISSLRTGLFSLLDGECRKSSSSGGSSPETLVEKIKAQHYGSPRYFEVAADLTRVKDRGQEQQHQQQLSRYFGIRHFVADVIYDTSHFLEANSDRLCDDIVAVFHKSHCSFGFVSHLFGGELRQLTQLSGSAQTTGNTKQGVLPRGLKFRIAPTASHSPATSHNHGGGSGAANQQLPTTLTADFHNRLDNLLRTLVHARPHFVRCIKLNDHGRPGLFERSSVARQVRALQILETVNLMAGGLPHRMRFKAFSARYRLLVTPSRLLLPNKKVVATATTGEEERLPADCRLILAAFERRRLALALDAGAFANSAASVSAVLGKKHIFLSESARQQLELVRTERRMRAAATIQTAWRAWRERRNQPQQWSQKFFHQQQQQNHHLHFNSLTKKYPGSPNGLAAASPANVFNVHRPARPQPITGTPPPPQHQIHSHIYHQLQQSQLSAEAPPPPPPSSLQFSPPSEALKSSVAVAPLTSNSAAVELCDFNMVRETCALFGIDLHTPPPLPPARPYSILTSLTGTFKCHFPQLRTMRADYVDPSSKRLLLAKNQQVVVLGNAAGGRRGLLVVQHPQTSSSAKPYQNAVIEVPHQFFDSSVLQLPPPTSSTLPSSKLGTLCI